MVSATAECGYNVIYGDTDSIFVQVNGKSETECITAGIKVKLKICEISRGRVFSSIGADVKGNYKSIVISAKKKHEGLI